jgi:arylformamidase
MKIKLEHQERIYEVDLSKGIDISSRYGLKAKEPKAWNTVDVEIEAFEGEGWTGSVKAGAPVNFFNVAFNPHGNGTHTESIGHIREDQLSINEALQSFHFMVRLVKMQSEKIGDDQVVTKDAFLKKQISLDTPALAICVDRFSPNHDFSNSNPPYFEAELLAYLAEHNVAHFITNLPSVDREEDAGALAGHKAFWNFHGEQREKATITELVQLPDTVEEGLYFLNMQVAPFHSDAAASRLVLYTLQ